MTGSGGSANDFVRLWLEGMRAVAAGAGSGAGGGDAWRRAEGLFSAFTAFAEAFAAEHAARAGAPGASPFDPAGWLRPEGGGGMADLWRWVEGPELADMFAEERRLLAESREWAALTAALTQYRQVVGEGWMRAFRRFADALAAEGEAARREGRQGPGWDAMIALWRREADAEMSRTHRSEPFLTAQRQLLEAQLAVREAVRARVSRFSDLLGIPTREEVDDLHETVHALRRELRELRARLREGAGG